MLQQVRSYIPIAPPPRAVSAATPSALDSRKGSLVEPATPSTVTKLVLKPPKSQVAPAPAPAPVPTPKPTKPVPSWARSGLVFAEKKVIEALLKRLQLSESAKWFMVPVDPDRHNAPKYVCLEPNSRLLIPFQLF